MANYLKSELYRVVRSRSVYLVVGACAVLMLAMNVLLAAVREGDPNFPYANTGFVFGMMTSGMNIAMFTALVFTSIIFAEEYKNRTMSNNLAFGLSETKVLLGKFIVTLLASVPGMLVVEGVLVGSAYLLLEDSGIEELYALLRANAACIPLFIAAISIYLAFIFWLKNELRAIWVWLGVVMLGSQIVSLLGLKFQFFKWLSGWLIFELVSAYDFDEVTGEMYMIWDKAAGMTRAMSAGIITAIIFLVLGMIVTRKKA
ncbi:MAG: ABC transporter permease [Lachnospiraceae bacterium]|nr:ABC transporter permease [Lachnospiraceae bacterium]